MSRAARKVSSSGHKINTAAMCSGDSGGPCPKDVYGISHLSVFPKKQESMGHVNIPCNDLPVLASHEG